MNRTIKENPWTGSRLEHLLTNGAAGFVAAVGDEKNHSYWVELVVSLDA